MGKRQTVAEDGEHVRHALRLTAFNEVADRPFRTIVSAMSGSA
jgi:hypothetical protein